MIDFLRSSKAHVFVEHLSDELTIGEDDYHHLSRVLRIKKQDIVSAASNGSVRKYEIASIDKSSIHLRALGAEQSVHENEIVIAVSLFKLDRLEWGIAKAVELGVTKIIIGTTERSSIKLNEKSKVKLETRIAMIVRNSAMQSRRSVLPQIDIVGDLLGLLDSEQAEIVLCEPDGTSDIGPNGKTILIGPEGGFSKEELGRLNGGIELWNMAPAILRSETAMAFATGLASRSFKGT